MKVFLSLQQRLDILHEDYCALGVIRSTACKYNVDLVQIQQWKKNLAGMDGDVESSEGLYISSSASNNTWCTISFTKSVKFLL